MALLASGPALAEGGAGSGTGAGAGGGGFVGNPGGAGTGSGGGGGGGAGGGAGGNGGSNAGSGGAGGVAPGGAGGNGGNATANNRGGGGGGGGANGNGAGSDTIDNASALSGGAGGAGGNGLSGVINQGGGGGGGAGGYGAVVTGADGANTNTSAISGGAGGAGGRGANTLLGAGANGGDGGVGVQFTNTGADFANSGSVSGGAGGKGGDGRGGGLSGNGGAGGTAIIGSGLTVNNDSLAITGGAGGNGGTATLPNSTGGAGGNGIAGTDLAITNGTGTIGGGAGGVGALVGGAGGAGIVGSGTLITNNGGTISGADGGNGSLGIGGAGGAGINGSGFLVTNTGNVRGGAGADGDTVDGTGGAGITGSLMTIDNSGSGDIRGGASPAGTGGAGISGSNLIITNAGTIRGGDGGTLIIPLAGVGITGSDLVVVNRGGISGGLSGATRQNAVTFTGGVNSLELQAGQSFTGNVVALSGGTDTLKLGGTTNSSFDVSTIGGAAQFRNFASYVKTGDSTWTLTGTTNAATPWTLDGGTLSISSNGALGAANASVTFNGGTLQATASFTSTNRPTTVTAGNAARFQVDSLVVLGWNGGITGVDGGLQLTGGGTLNLGAANTYTGPTAVIDGRLQAGAAGAFSTTSAFTVGTSGVLDLNGYDQTIGSLAGDAGSSVINSGAGAARLTAGGDNSSTTFAGIIQDGPGNTVALTKAGTGTMILTGANTYTGGTIVSGGTLQGNATSLQGNIENNATLSFVQNATGVYQGVISGSGNLTATVGTGAILALTGNNTYSGTTTISGDGTLTVGLGGTTGSLGTGNVINNGSLSFFRSDDITVANQISGTGSLLQSGTGVLTLTGANTFTGTVGFGGTIAVAADNNLGNDAALLFIGGTLRFLSSFNLDSDRVIAMGAGASGTIDTNGFDTTINQAIGEVGAGGSLIKNGTGKLTLLGANSYSGGTVVNGGILEGNSTSLQGNIENNATLSFVQAAPGVYAGVISGIGNLTVDGNAPATVLALTGNNTYSGTTTINSGTLAIGLGGMTGSLGTGNVINNSLLAFFRSDDITVGNQISGTGSLIQGGTGTLTLTGVNTYTGQTVFAAGTIAVSADNNLGNDGVLNFQGGTLKFLSAFNLDSDRAIVLNGNGTIDTNGFNTTIARAITGAGGLLKAGAGTLILGGANVYTGGTTVTGGTLQGDTTSLQGNIENNATLSFVQTATGLYAGVISGTGNLTVDGNAAATALVLTGNNTYSGTTTINSGTLAVGFGGTTGSLGTGNAINNGLLAFFRSDDITVGNQISGTGSLIQGGTGTLTLAGANTYTGQTVFAGGAIAASADNNLGNDGVLNFQGGTLRFLSSFNLDSDRAVLLNGSGTIDTNGFNTTLSQGITDGAVAGALIKTGTGMLMLNGVNTYTGGTTVDEGTLSLNGSVVGNVGVLGGGTLAGTGTVGGNLSVFGNVAPGNSIGTLTVNGTYTQAAGSTYTAEVSGAGQSDLIRANNASLQGGTVMVQPQAGTFRRTTTYTLVSTTGTTTGTYAGVTSSNSRLVPTLGYAGNGVTVTLLNLDASYNFPNFSPNQNAVAYVLNQANATATGDFANVLNTLSNIGYQDSAALARILDSIAGQNYSGFGNLNLAAVQTFMANFQFQAGGGQSFGNTASAAPGRTYLGLAEACDVACDSGAPLWGAWGGGVGAFGTVAGNPNAYGITYSLGGFAAGIDRKFGNNFMAGVATGFSAASLNTQGMPGYGTSNTLQFALYGEYAAGPVYFDILAGYAHSDNRMSRPIVIPGLPYRVAQGYTTANQFFGQLEGGYRIDVDSRFGGYVMPFARLQGSTSTQNGFTESGADSLNLAVAAQTTNSLRTVLGAQFGAAIATGWHRPLNVMLKAGWSHDYADLSRPVTASFAGAPALNFTTQGAVAPRDGVVLGFGLNTSVTEQTSLYLRYDGDLAGGNTNHALSAGIRFVW